MTKSRSEMVRNSVTTNNYTYIKLLPANAVKTKKLLEKAATSGMNNIDLVTKIRDQFLEEFEEWITPVLDMDYINMEDVSITYVLMELANLESSFATDADIESCAYLKFAIADGGAIRVWGKALQKIEARLNYLHYVNNNILPSTVDTDMVKVIKSIDNISAKYECSTVKSVNYVAGAFIWVGDRFTKTGNKIAALSVKIPNTCKLIKEKFTSK